MSSVSNPPTVIGSDLIIGSNSLLTTDLEMRQSTSTIMGIFDRATGLTARQIELGCVNLYGMGVIQWTNGSHIADAADIDDYAALLGARDNGVGVIEVARLQGAAIPYFRVQPLVINPSAQAGNPDIEGAVYYSSSTHKLYFYNGTAWKEISYVA